MSWPTRTWTQDGWQDFKSPLANSRPKGLPADWEDYTHEVERGSNHNATFWDVIDNPLYEAAANASNIDWDEFVEESLAQIGSEEDYEAAAAWADDRKPTQPVRGIGYHNLFNQQSSSDSAYDNLTPEQQAIADQFPDKEPTQTAQGFGPNGSYTRSPLLMDLLKDKDADELRDWGIDRGGFGDVADNLDTLHQWLWQTIKTHDLQDAPIIRRGPQGSDYGIDGDIWEHYGLDQAPGPPKEMDVNYEFNLLDARPSTRTYATPSGYPQLDTSTESISGPTSYETYLNDRRVEYEAFHDPNKPATSYGEPVVTEDDTESTT